jgi:molybdopterin biosynthesis enzyme
VALENEQREILEEVVRLLESVRDGIGRMDKPGFDDGRVDGYAVTALSAATAALKIATRRQEPADAREPDR